MLNATFFICAALMFLMHTLHFPSKVGQSNPSGYFGHALAVGGSSAGRILENSENQYARIWRTNLPQTQGPSLQASYYTHYVNLVTFNNLAYIRIAYSPLVSGT